ncbi:RNase H domain-containing protein [Trichonephila clavipes]|nr:RNase H domain-containing protein [Trichonephila clavipes]
MSHDFPAYKRSLSILFGLGALGGFRLGCSAQVQFHIARAQVLPPGEETGRQNYLQRLYGGAGIILLLPDGNNYKHKINTGIIVSNFTSELVAIREALILYQQNPHVIDSTEGLVIFSDSKSAIEAIRNGETNISCDIITLLEQLHNKKRKSCILQWISAHVNIEGNEGADSLAKEA